MVVDFDRITSPELVDSEIIYFEGYSIFRRKDKIIQLQFRDVFDGEIGDAVNILDCIRKLSVGELLPLLVIYGKYNQFSKETRAFIARSTATKADALVINSLPLKILGNFYLKFDRPNRPTHLFTDVGSAVTWLKLLD
jgi:hypothetical protein